jgi:hypothetical protein
MAQKHAGVSEEAFSHRQVFDEQYHGDDVLPENWNERFQRCVSLPEATRQQKLKKYTVSHLFGTL